MIIAMPIDSIEALEEAELPPGAARAIVRVIANHVTTAVSGLATQRDVSDQFLAMERRFTEFQMAMRSEFSAFQAQMRSEFAAFQSQMKRDFAVFQAEIKSSFYEHRIQLDRQMMKWFLAVLGLLLPAYTSLVYLMFQAIRK